MRSLTIILVALVLTAGVALGPVSALAADGLAPASAPVAVESCQRQDTLRVPVRANPADIPIVHGTGALFVDEFTKDDALFSGSDYANIEVTRTASADAQLEAYLTCTSPFLRGSQTELSYLAPVTEANQATRQVPIYLYGFSQGFDVLVGRTGQKSTAIEYLSGKTIATDIRTFGFLTHTLAQARERAGPEWQEPQIVFAANPAEAFAKDQGIDAAVVTSLEADALTAGPEGIGTGSEGSVEGAGVILSTRTASRVLPEVLVVRSDYLQNNQEQVANLVRSLIKVQEVAEEDIAKRNVDWQKVAEFFLGNSALAYEANARFFALFQRARNQQQIQWSTEGTPYGWREVNNRVQTALLGQDLIDQRYERPLPPWNYEAFADEVWDQGRAQLSPFRRDALQAMFQDLQKTGELDARTIEEFKITFDPNQSSFNQNRYFDIFDRVIRSAQENGGGAFTVEAHADPTKYLLNKYFFRQTPTCRREYVQRGSSGPRLTRAPQGSECYVTDVELKRFRQAARNLSMERAKSVREAILARAQELNVQVLHRDQFLLVGHGFEKPVNGTCEMRGREGGPTVEEPCGGGPDIQAQNRRVVFRTLLVETDERTADIYQTDVDWSQFAPDAVQQPDADQGQQGGGTGGGVDWSQFAPEND